jgi:3-hydroxyisobutyrate dehydrogenase
VAKIGFVGLGHMGLPMAINLVKAGHSVTGYDLQADALKQFSEAKGLIAANLGEAALNQDIIITMLQKGDQVQEVCRGTAGLFSQATPGSLFIDCSTIDVDTARAVNQLAKEYRLMACDAPVSGGVIGAAAATLTIMVGAEEETFAKAQPILSCMGKKIIHTGNPGSGQAAKICNNMVLAISMIGISEAFTLGQKLGLSAQKLFDVMSTSSGQCWALNQYVPVAGILENVPANHDYKPGFASTMMLKDLLLSQEAANSVQLKTPLGAQSTSLYQQLINQGEGDLDFSAIIKLMGKDKGA